MSIRDFNLRTALLIDLLTLALDRDRQSWLAEMCPVAWQTL